MKKITIRNNSNVSIGGVKPGATAQIKVDDKGTPLEKFWRSRLRDSAIDGAITVEKQKPLKKAKTDTEG